MLPPQIVSIARSSAAGVLALVVLVGCGGSDDAEPSTADTTPSATPSESSPAGDPGCEEVGELLTSVQMLADVSPRQDGVEAVRAAAADSRVAMDAAVAAVAEGLQPAVEEVQTALAAVRTAVDDLDQSYPGQGAAGIAEALDGLRDALVSLGAAVDLECPEQ